MFMNRNFLCLLGLCLLFLVNGLSQSASDNIEFIILQMNDVYEISPLEGGKAGGLARVATLKKELLQENPNTIAVLSGDFLSPSLMTNLEMENGEQIAGLQMVETLNALGLDYVTFGNHEFDLSDPDLLQKRIDQSAFRYTVCNALRVKDGVTVPFTQQIDGKDVPVPEYIIHEFSNEAGQKVRLGLLGVVLPFNKQDYLQYKDVTTTFRDSYHRLKQESDVVVGITHLAIDEDIQLAKDVPGIPLFLGGHDHHNMSHYVENTIITKADANAKTVYIHRITYNPASGMTRIQSTLKTIDERIADDPVTQKVVTKWDDQLNASMNGMGYDPKEALMTTNEVLVVTEAKVRTQQTNFGHLTTQAMEAMLPGADVYVLNSGGMRLDDNIVGVITQFDILRTFPFGGSIVTQEIPGTILQQVLENGLNENQGEGGYLQVNYAAKMQGKWLIKGQPLEAGKTYKIVLPEFLASGLEQNLDMLGEFPMDKAAQFSLSGKMVRNDIRDVVMAYMREFGEE